MTSTLIVLAVIAVVIFWGISIYNGLVTMRQRPGTATGVVFVTLEDESGSTNLIVWNSVVEAQRRELLGARLLGVDGEVQREGPIVHVIARRLLDYTPLLGRLPTASRDFH